ncbi:unnamed protein product, partial [marine sediment metagenome]
MVRRLDLPFRKKQVSFSLEGLSGLEKVYLSP